MNELIHRVCDCHVLIMIRWNAEICYNRKNLKSVANMYFLITNDQWSLIIDQHEIDVELTFRL